MKLELTEARKLNILWLLGISVNLARQPDAVERRRAGKIVFGNLAWSELVGGRCYHLADISDLDIRLTRARKGLRWPLGDVRLCAAGVASRCLMTVRNAGAQWRSLVRDIYMSTEVMRGAVACSTFRRRAMLSDY